MTGLKKNEDKRDPQFVDEADGYLKNESSRRTIPVAPALAEAIDRHIHDHHGPRPEDPNLDRAWLSRRLISSQTNPRPRNTVVVDRWDHALARTGLDFDTLGFRINRHFLRKSGSTVIGIGNIRGKLWSSYLGHKTPAEFGGALTTVQHYFDLPDEELVLVAERWQEVVRESVGDLIIVEEWWSTPHMTIVEAALALQVHPTHVGHLLKRGRLADAPANEVAEWRHKAGKNSCENRRMVSGPSIQAEIERRARLHDRFTQKEVGDELHLPLWQVRTLQERGLLRATQDDDSVWNFDADSVHEVAALLAHERSESHLYMGPAEAANLFGLSSYRFGRLCGHRCSQRVLLVTQQVQYLRTDVEALVNVVESGEAV